MRPRPRRSLLVRPSTTAASSAAALVTAALILGACGQPGPTTGRTETASPGASSPLNMAPSSPASPPSAIPTGGDASGRLIVREFTVPAGSHPHDVSPAADGGVWYTGQQNGTLGHLDPRTGAVREIRLGSGSAPHGVITSSDGSAWITDGGLNSILRVDPSTGSVRSFPLPASRQGANLNTAVFDRAGTLWFTGQAGIYGRLDPPAVAVQVFDAPKGPGPYGITSTADGAVWFASLAGSYVGRIDPATSAAAVHEPPTRGQGARRVWSDRRGRIWVSEWNAGQVGMLDPAAGAWREWRLPGPNPMAYAVFVDDAGIVWLTDFGANAIVRFDPATEQFLVLPLPSPGAAVRQLHGRSGEVWGAESATDKLVLVSTR
jgi:virginiamycin B lyase